MQRGTCHFVSYWPCISIQLCNKNQLDALFILSLFRQSTNRQLTGKHNTYQLLYIYSIPPVDELQICPKHVEVDWRNKLRINIASSWFLLHRSLSIESLNSLSCKVRKCHLPIFPPYSTPRTWNDSSREWTQERPVTIITFAIIRCFAIIWYFLCKSNYKYTTVILYNREGNIEIRDMYIDKMYIDKIDVNTVFWPLRCRL
jgi:hypothetical protein